MRVARIPRARPGTRSDPLDSLGAVIVAAVIGCTALATAAAKASVAAIPEDNPVSSGDSQLFAFEFGGGFGNRGMLSSSVVNLTWSHVGGPFGTGPALDPIFAQFSWTPSDAGRTVTVTSGNDPNFNAFATLLTDGRPEELVLYQAAGPAPTFMEGSGFRESDVVFGNGIDPRVDMHGYQIESLSMELVSMSIQNPADDSGSYMVNYNIVFSGSGHPVPEPAFAAVLLSVLWRARPRAAD